MCCSTRSGSWNKLMRLALAAMICGILIPVAMAEDVSEPKPRSQTSPATVPSGKTPAVLLKDPVSGLYRFYMILPNGEKQLLETIPPVQMGPPRASPAYEDYLDVVESLAAGERYIIGVELKTIPSGLHARLGLKEEIGLVVSKVLEGKPAEAAGLQKQDILLKINGKAVSQPADVVRLINEMKETPIQLTLIRDAGPFEVSLTPVEARGGDWPKAGSSNPTTPDSLPQGVFPPGMQMIGPGIIIPANRNGEFEKLQAEISTMQTQIKELAEQVRQLQSELKKNK